MRVAYVLLAFGALTLGASDPASAGCYRDCDDDGYRYERYAPVVTYYRPPVETYVVRRSYDEVAVYDVAPAPVAVDEWRPACGWRHRYHHKSHRHGCRSHGKYGHRPYLVYGDVQSQAGPVYTSTGKYHYGPYVSHRATFGYGGCRAAVVPYGASWHLASNC